ncbi:MAG: toll/interleukin-1 receptor domain-containing protein [Clostridia bacterium]|nr:toll/interleukin-1 receptor domain-containing protein [Clostridia bacterium]
MNSVELKEFICPNCQSKNFSVEDNVHTCKSCLSTFRVNQLSSKVFVDLMVANNERNSGNFEKAKNLYKEIIANDPNEDLSDVYFGLLLSEQRVIFEEDGKGEKFPSFYKINEDETDKIEDTFTYNRAITYALKHNPDRIDVFNNLVEKIENAKKMYLDIKKKTKPFDVFICFKNSDENGNHTKDRELAMDIYNEFNDKYNMFFSEKTLKEIKSNYREYEPNIYYGLYTAKVMLLICSKKDYIESKWLKNEWSRFTQINKQGNENKCIIPIFTDNFNPNDLPDELWHSQGIFDDRKLMNNIDNALENIIHPVDKIEELRKLQQEELDRQRKEILAEQERERLEQEKLLKDIEEKYAKLEKLYKVLSVNPEDEEKQILRIKMQKETLKRKKEERIQSGMPLLSKDRKTLSFGTYIQNAEDPEVLYWQVLSLEGDICKVCTQKVIDHNEFDTIENNFADSLIKTFLFSTILRHAFNDKQKDYLLKTKHKFGEDYVTLLSKAEVNKMNKNDRAKLATVEAWGNGNSTHDYWLLDQCKMQGFACAVSENGEFEEISMELKNIGVVPVVTLKLDKECYDEFYELE